MEPDKRLAKARRLIERKSIEWYDFCANIGQIPDNVAHLKSIVAMFADWLEEN